MQMNTCAKKDISKVERGRRSILISCGVLSNPSVHDARFLGF